MDNFDLDTIRKNLHDFGLFLWDGKAKQFLGRGGRSWLEVGTFYIVYYAALAGFFVATILGFHHTIDSIEPRLLGDSNLLRGNPGLGFRPMPDDLGSTLIRVSSNEKQIKAYVKNINAILDRYKNDNLTNVDCSDINGTRPEETIPCRFNFTALTEHCNENNKYGFDERRPCVLLKLNKIYGWTPNPWEVKEIQNISQIPEHIKDIYTADQVWIDCHGENPADNDNLGKRSEILFYPQQGFPLSFYPYINQKDYRSPLVFVKFMNLTEHVGIMVECVALDRNINVDKRLKEGSVHFEIMLDN